MIRDPDSPASFDLAAAFGRHQPGRSRGGRVIVLRVGCGEAVAVIVLRSLVPAVVVRAPCRKFSTLRVRGLSLLCC